MRFYVIEITTTSSGAEERHIDWYSDKPTALRKFHQVMTKIGAGPKVVRAMLLNEQMNVLQIDIWTKPEDPVEETTAATNETTTDATKSNTSADNN